MLKNIVMFLAAMSCVFLPCSLEGGFQSDQEGLMERGDYSCNFVYAFTQICTDGTEDYPPRVNVPGEQPDEPLEYKTCSELKNNATLNQDNYLISPNGDSYFFVNFAGDLFVFSKETRKSYFMFSTINKKLTGSGRSNEPFKVQYKEGQLKIFNKYAKLVKTLHLHQFGSQNSARNSRLTLSDENILKIKVGNTVVWSSNSLRRKQVLKYGQSIFSANGNFECKMKEKCQLVVYDRRNYAEKSVFGEESDSDKCELHASDSSQLTLKIVDSGRVQKSFPLKSKGDRKNFICPNNGVPNL